MIEIEQMEQSKFSISKDSFFENLYFHYFSKDSFFENLYFHYFSKNFAIESLRLWFLNDSILKVFLYLPTVFSESIFDIFLSLFQYYIIEFSSNALNDIQWNSSCSSRIIKSTKNSLLMNIYILEF